MDFQSLLNKARNEMISTGLFALGVISTFLPWISGCYYSICLNYSLVQGMGFWGLVLIIALFAGLASSAYSLYMAYKNIVDQRRLMFTFIVNAGAATSGVIFGLINMLGASNWGIGFIIFLVSMVAAAALNGMKVFANKELAKQVVNDVKSDAQKKMEEQKKNAQMSQSTEEKTPEEAPTTMK